LKVDINQKTCFSSFYNLILMHNPVIFADYFLALMIILFPVTMGFFVILLEMS